MAQSLSSVVAALCLTLGGAFGPFAKCDGTCYENRCDNCMDAPPANCPPSPLCPSPTICPRFYKITDKGTFACFPEDGKACGSCSRVGDQGYLFEQFSFPNPWQTCVINPFSFIDPYRPQQYWIFDADPDTKVVHYRYYTDPDCTIPDLTHALDDPYATGPCVPMKDCTFEPDCFCLSHLTSFL